MPGMNLECDYCGRSRRPHRMTTRRLDAATRVTECAEGCKPGSDNRIARILATNIGDLIKGRISDPTPHWTR